MFHVAKLLDHGQHHVGGLFHDFNLPGEIHAFKVLMAEVDALRQFLDRLGNFAKRQRQGLNVLAFETGHKCFHQFRGDLLRDLFLLAARECKIVQTFGGRGGFDHFNDQPDAFVGFAGGIFQQLIKPVGLSEEQLQ